MVLGIQLTRILQDNGSTALVLTLLDQFQRINDSIQERDEQNMRFQYVQAADVLTPTLC